jgi:hypothetical protein
MARKIEIIIIVLFTLLGLSIATALAVAVHVRDGAVSEDGANCPTSGTSSFTNTYTDTIGNEIHIIVQGQGTTVNPTCSTITDNKGDTFFNMFPGGFSGSLTTDFTINQLFIARNVAGGATTFTCTYANSGAGGQCDITMSVMEWSNTGTGNPTLDTNGSNGNSYTSNTTNLTTGTGGTLTRTDDYAVAIFGLFTSGTLATGPTGGYTVSTGVNGQLIPAWNATVGTVAPVCSLTTNSTVRGHAAYAAILLGPTSSTTPTISPTVTVTATATLTPTATATLTATPSATMTGPTPSPTPSITATISTTPTATPTAMSTPGRGFGSCYVNSPPGVMLNDVVIGEVTYDSFFGSYVLTPPDSSWHQFANWDLNLADVTWYYHDATASEPPIYLWSLSTDVSIVCGIFSQRGNPTPSSPLDVIGIPQNHCGSPSTCTALSITPTLPNDIIGFGGGKFTIGLILGPNNSGLGSTTSWVPGFFEGADFDNMGEAGYYLPSMCRSAGPTGNVTNTVTAVAEASEFMFALKAAATTCPSPTASATSTGSPGTPTITPTPRATPTTKCSCTPTQTIQWFTPTLSATPSATPT